MKNEMFRETHSADWSHEDRFDVVVGLTPLDIYRRMTANPPAWIAWAFKVRDRLVAPFGVRAIGGFSGDVGSLTVGDQIDFFTIAELTADTLALVVEDHHLDVEVRLTVTRGAEVDNARIVTRVWLKNAIGRAYMVPVGIAHPVIVKRLAARVAA
jgi:Protein of unknown function (DUF2867)